MQIPRRELLIHRKIEELKNSSEMQPGKSKQKKRLQTWKSLHMQTMCVCQRVNCFSSLRYVCVSSRFCFRCCWSEAGSICCNIRYVIYERLDAECTNNAKVFSINVCTFPKKTQQQQQQWHAACMANCSAYASFSMVLEAKLFRHSNVYFVNERITFDSITHSMWVVCWVMLMHGFDCLLFFCRTFFRSPFVLGKLNGALEMCASIFNMRKILAHMFRFGKLSKLFTLLRKFAFQSHSSITRRTHLRPLCKHTAPSNHRNYRIE